MTHKYTLPTGEEVEFYKATLHDVVETAISPLRKFIGLLDRKDEEDERLCDLFDLMNILLDRARGEIDNRFAEIESRIGRTRILYADFAQTIVPGGQFLDVEIDPPRDNQEGMPWN